MIVGAGNDGQWRKLCEAMGSQRTWRFGRSISEMKDRNAHRPQLVRDMEAILTLHPTQHWLTLSRVSAFRMHRSTPMTRCLLTPGAAPRPQDEHGTACGAGGGAVAMVVSPIRMSDTPVTYRHAPPVKGSGTESILLEVLGKSAAEAQALRDRGVVSRDRGGAGLTPLPGCTCPQCGRCAAFACAERLIKRRQVIHDALQLHFDTVNKAVALRTIPLEAVQQARRARALNHQATRFRLRPLWRVAQMWRHQVHGAFLEFNAVALAAIHDVQEGVALELPEIFLQRVVAKVGALVRATDDGHDEISAGPDLLFCRPAASADAHCRRARPGSRLTCRVAPFRVSSLQ